MVLSIFTVAVSTVQGRKRFQECETDKNCKFGSACIKSDNEQLCKCSQRFNCHMYKGEEEEHDAPSFSCVLYDDNYFNQFDEEHPPTQLKRNVLRSKII